MKFDYYRNVIKMLTSQLAEEVENYQLAVNNHQPSWQLTEMQQRINSLQTSLFSLNRWQETSEL